MFLLLILILGSIRAQDHHCHYSAGRLSKTNLHQKFVAGIQSLDTRNFLRISLIYSEAFNRLSNKDKIKKEILEPAVKFWEQTLIVKEPLVSPLLIDQFCTTERVKYGTIRQERILACYDKCDTADLPRELFAKCYEINGTGNIHAIGDDGKGVPNTDLAIFVDDDDNCSDGTLAMGSSLKLDARSDRPVLGLIITCSKNMDFTKNQKAVDVVLHELAHVLAFASDLYAYYRDEKGQPRTPRDENGKPNLGKMFTQPDMPHLKPSDSTLRIFNKTELTPVGLKTKTLAMLRTPKLLRVAKEHFNCSSLEGVLMEDSTGESNGWSHFEKRFFYNNLMGPAISDHLIITRFELALIEDSGWYIADYSKAVESDFGKNLGCEFLNSSCYEYLQLKRRDGLSAFPYCYQRDRLQCTADREAFLQCLLQIAPTDFPLEYRYLEDKSLIYPDPYTDYCPMYPANVDSMSSMSYGVHSCRSQNTRNEINNDVVLKNVFEINNSSKCVYTSEEWKSKRCNGTYSSVFFGAGCYKIRCSETDRLIVEINKKEFQCLYDQQQLNITVTTADNIIQGAITCPTCTDICRNRECNIKPVKLAQKQKQEDLNCNSGNGVVQFYSVIIPIVIVCYIYLMIL